MAAEVCEIMNETVNRLCAQVGDHPLSMLCPPRPATPDCDGETLTQALVCLLNDALSCTDPSCSVVFSGDIQDNFVTFLISDDGGSLPEEELQSIFHVPGSELALGRELIESCGGTLTACNEPHGGLSYVTVIPLKTDK
ncbi:MAG: hypothetical protein E7442_04235 [Ruminococcaceae bacterium]|nr:hypothetical protein [Oscillospiraceae bacterium]